MKYKVEVTCQSCGFIFLADHRRKNGICFECKMLKNNLRALKSYYDKKTKKTKM